MSTTTDFLAKLQKMTEEKSVQPKTSNKTAAVNLPELGSAAVLFSPKKNQTKGKSTQQNRVIIITDGKSIQQKSEHNNTYMMQRNATKK